MVNKLGLKKFVKENEYMDNIDITLIWDDIRNAYMNEIYAKFLSKSINLRRCSDDKTKRVILYNSC